MTERLLQEAVTWGIQPSYEDSSGRWRDSPIDSVELALNTLKEASDRPPGDGSLQMDLSCVPPSRQAWGWSVQAPSLVSHSSQGMGDLADLRDFGRRARELGASFLLVSPLGAGLPFRPSQPSPYFRSSRLFRDPLYLRLPGGRLRVSDPIDREAAFSWKLPRLRSMYGSFDGAAAFDSYLEEQGTDLLRFAQFQALAEDQGKDWRGWPGPLKDPASLQVTLWAKERADDIRFQCWVQWRIDEQLRQAGSAIDLVTDVPVGSDPAGAEGWAWQHMMAEGFTVGAPPDDFNSRGQDWGVIPFHPLRLAREGYDPFRRLIRAAMRHAGGIRIDHVMGLFRLFWIPSGGTPHDGVYVRYPYRDLVRIVAEESRRTGSFVVGEDLGTVEPLVREVMKEAGILGYRVLWFEEDAKKMGGANLATVTTHDLPTIAGILTGSDAREQKTLGMDPGDHMKRLSQKLSRTHNPVVTAYRDLARSGASLIAVSVEDALGVKERPNMPGTLAQRPNWSKVLPVKIEEFFDQPLVLEIAEVLRERAFRPR